MVKNYMEDLVENALAEIIENYPNMCKCKKCMDDIMAKSLNQLQPLYFSEDRGNVYSKLNSLESQFKTDILTELVKAIEVVTANPRH